MPATTAHGAPYPLPGDPNNIPAHIKALAEWSGEQLAEGANLNDSTVTTLLRDKNSQAAAELNANFEASRDSAQMAARILDVATPRPSHAPVSSAGVFDPSRSAYNVAPALMRKFRAAYGRALSGTGQLHINVSGSSTPAGAGSGTLRYKTSWPALLKKQLVPILGDGGTGLVWLWDYLGTAGVPENDDRLEFFGNVVARNFGPFQKAGRGIYGEGGALEFTPEMEVDEFWVYGIGSPVGANVLVDGVSLGTLGNTATGTATYMALGGYAWNAGTSSGQRVFKIPVTMGQHTLRIEGRGTAADRTTILAVEGRRAGQGVRVTNSALSGMSAWTQRYDDTASGYFGMSASVDMVGADLTIVQIGTNDWQAHETAANFKANYGLYAHRAKHATTGVLGGTAPRSDLIFIAGQPLNHAALPPASPGADNPPLAGFQTSLWEMADQYGARLVDLGHRWESFEVSSPLGYYSDNLHASPLGSADIARAVFEAIQA